MASPAEGAGPVPLQPVLPNIPPLSESERLTAEKAILGFYISGHPLEPFRGEIELLASHRVSDLGTWSDQPMQIGAVVTAIRRQISKKSGAEFARLGVEDFSGAAELLVFPEAWASLKDRIQTDVPLLIKGGYSKRDQDAENPSFIVESVQRLVDLRSSGQIAVAIELAAGDTVTGGVLRDVRAVAEAHPGSTALEVRWRDRNGVTSRLRSASLTLSTGGATVAEPRALLGEERVRLVRGS
jgi:DNA polymerase-3 subunit alpha